MTSPMFQKSGPYSGEAPNNPGSRKPAPTLVFRQNSSRPLLLNSQSVASNFKSAFAANKYSNYRLVWFAFLGVGKNFRLLVQSYLFFSRPFNENCNFLKNCPYDSNEIFDNHSTPYQGPTFVSMRFREEKR